MFHSQFNKGGRGFILTEATDETPFQTNFIVLAYSNNPISGFSMMQYCLNPTGSIYDGVISIFFNSSNVIFDTYLLQPLNLYWVIGLRFIVFYQMHQPRQPTSTSVFIKIASMLIFADLLFENM